MGNFTRRGFILATTATLGSRAVVPFAKSGGGHRILTLVYDKSLGMMRAVEKIVP